MRKDIKINVDTQTDGISLSSRRLGISSENLQGKIIFTPKPFIDGICRMYIEGHGTIEMDKQEDCYTLDIKSSLLITPHIDVCFKITEPEQDNGVPIYATKIMQFEVLDTIESNEPIPDQYPQWKDVLDNYTEEKKGELDTYTTEIQTDLKAYKKDLEDEMLTTKENLVEDINNITTENINEFNTNVETKTNTFNDNATEKTTNYNTNTETKLKEYNDNSTTKIEEYNTNATNKVNEFNENVDSLENELTELASQMPWNTTEIQDSIHIEDSAKYSRNKLGLFGNLVQEVSETGNNIFDGIMELGTIDNGTGEELNSTTIIRSKNYLDISELTQIRVVRSDGYVGKDYYVGLRFYDADKNFLKYSTTSLGNSMTLSTETGIEGYKYLRFVITNTTDLTLKYGINKDASEIYEDYIPNKPSIEYPSMPVVATGVQKIRKIDKNIFNNDYWEQGMIKDADGTILSNNSYIRTKLIPIKPNEDYVLNMYTERLYEYDINGNWIKTTQYSSPTTFAKKNLKIKTNANTCYVRFRYHIGHTDSIITTLADMKKQENLLAIGTDVNILYEPYTEETFELDLGTTELCKIVDENNNVVAQDRVVYKDDKWQFEKNVGKYILKNAVWNKSSKTEVNRYFCNLVIYTATGGRDRKDLVSNCFKAISIIQSDANDIGICRYNDRGFIINFNLYDTNFDTLEKFNEYIQNSDAMVYYPNKSVIYEDCTPAQSEVLDKLYKLSLQKGTNNIYVESENGVTTELQLTYMQDLMSQINELKQAMLNIGGN